MWNFSIELDVFIKTVAAKPINISQFKYLSNSILKPKRKYQFCVSREEQRRSHPSGQHATNSHLKYSNSHELPLNFFYMRSTLHILNYYAWQSTCCVRNTKHNRSNYLIDSVSTQHYTSPCRRASSTAHVFKSNYPRFINSPKINPFCRHLQLRDGFKPLNRLYATFYALLLGHLDFSPHPSQ